MPIKPTTSKRRLSVLDMPLGLDRSVGNQSLQVHASLRSAILDARRVAGLRLPSSRSLADQLSVRRNAIVGAYEHRLSDGLVETRVGDGIDVAAGRRMAPAAKAVYVTPSHQFPTGVTLKMERKDRASGVGARGAGVGVRGRL